MQSRLQPRCHDTARGRRLPGPVFAQPGQAAAGVGKQSPEGAGLYQPGEKLPAEPARSVRAVKALPGCKTPFQPVKPLSDVECLMLLIPTSLVGQQLKEEIPVLLLQVVELVVGSRGAHWCIQMFCCCLSLSPESCIPQPRCVVCEPWCFPGAKGSAPWN